MNKKFEIISPFKPSGDQPEAIEAITNSLIKGEKDQVLLGVTGSGKTFTMANIIQKIQRPALVMAHNKTLAAQIYSEMKELFPNNAVEYFVSYYDYYQPEAYIPKTDTFIEKDSSINEQIDLLRHSATKSLLERRDVIVVASVSCIYGLGSPESYANMTLELEVGKTYNRGKILNRIIDLQYERNDVDFSRGKFRVRGDIIDVFPSYSTHDGIRFSFFGDELEEIVEIDSLTGKKKDKYKNFVLYPNSHFVTPKEIINNAIKKIKEELKDRLNFLHENKKVLEAARLDSRTSYDIEMLVEAGTCKGIENYSRFLTGREAGSPPPTLFEYLPENSILFVDESHVTVPQIGAMYNGDRSRKMNLVEHGFRLPSALDNRPLKFEEWEEMRPQTVFVSATPSKYELERTAGVFTEQIIRPTGLLDPICIVKPVTHQVDDLIGEIFKQRERGERTLVTTLTKKMAENLSEYMNEMGIKVTYLHSEILTLERLEIIKSLRTGEIEVLVGINLLREGLDIPECSLIAILDADKEGFLRSETSLIQTIGRAARNSNGRVILYADVMTKSLKKAISETERRRKIQEEYNKQHNITPQTIIKKIGDIFDIPKEIQDIKDLDIADPKNIDKKIDQLRKEMLAFASDLEFEKAAKIRDQIEALEALSVKFE